MRKCLNEEAIRKLITTYARRFYNKNHSTFYLSMMHLEDFIQEIYLKLLSIKVVKSLYSQGFLILCIFSKMKTILSEVRRRNKKLLLDLEKPLVIQDINFDYIKKLLKKQLSNSEYTIIVYKILNDMTYSEIAKELKTNKQKVYNIYKRGLENLKKIFINEAVLY